MGASKDHVELKWGSYLPLYKFTGVKSEISKKHQLYQHEALFSGFKNGLLNFQFYIALLYHPVSN